MSSGEYSKKQRALINEIRRIDDIIERGGCCWVCGYLDNPLIIEKHHIVRKRNSNITIPVCPNCHRTLTNKQKGWHVDWAKPNNPPMKKLAFILRGLSDIDTLKARVLREWSDKLLR